jgi:hypothetical protein
MEIGAKRGYRGEAVVVAPSKFVGAAATVTGAGGTSGPKGGKSADLYKQLDDFVKMTPAQRIRAALLEKLGLTEDELGAMPPDERAAVEAKMRELIQQQMQEAQAKQGGTSQTGQWIDTTA